MRGPPSGAAVACAARAARIAALPQLFGDVDGAVLEAAVTAAAMAKMSSATRPVYQAGMRTMASSNALARRWCSRTASWRFAWSTRFRGAIVLLA